MLERALIFFALLPPVCLFVYSSFCFFLLLFFFTVLFIVCVRVFIALIEHIYFFCSWHPILTLCVYVISMVPLNSLYTSPLLSFHWDLLQCEQTVMAVGQRHERMNPSSMIYVWNWANIHTAHYINEHGMKNDIRYSICSIQMVHYAH